MVEASNGQSVRDELGAAYRGTMEWVARVAPSNLSVLVLGESGAGKERVARAVHSGSGRRDQPFVAVNCTALSETLLDAELFGATRGAFTGADRDRPGLFRSAHGGSLFLDEIGDMAPSMQAKLLRALEERRVRPVGADAEIGIDVRLIAATHHDLAADVKAGTFRRDLFYRVAVVEVHVPPLRRRTEDLPRIVSELATRIERETGRGPLRISPCAMDSLVRHDWPGNIRELHAVLARGHLRTDDGIIRQEDLGLGISRDPDSLERQMIATALRESAGNVRRAAHRIGWTRQKLYRRMEALRLGATGNQRPSGNTSSESSTFQ